MHKLPLQMNQHFGGVFCALNNEDDKNEQSIFFPSRKLQTR